MIYKAMFVLLASLAIGFLGAGTMQPPPQQRMLDLPQGLEVPGDRTPPQYSFSRTPTQLLVSYYDYMIGSYNNLPLRVIPTSAAGGGYFLTYHGRRLPTSTRRVFYAYLDSNGIIYNNNEIGNQVINEGYPSLAVDPVSGKPMYAWHANVDADPALEVQFVSDAFMAGFPGLFNEIQTIIDNPITVISPDGVTTTDNEFIWPTAQVGPSPIAGKRRVYVLARNSVSHSQAACENVRIAYADFNGDNFENAVPLIWSYTSIPELDQWNVDPVWRRPFLALAVDGAGNLFYVGYHVGTDQQNNSIYEADIDVFKCNNFGQGSWTRLSSWSNLSTWNPPDAQGSSSGFFTNDNDVPYSNDQLFFRINNSSHLNAAVDNLGRIHVPAVWALTNSDLGYYPALQFVKEFIFDPANGQTQIREIFPTKHPSDTHNSCFIPWDTVAPWGVVDEFDVNYGPEMVNDWPFPHWDASAHSDAMLYHYNNLKITDANSEGMMAAVWQNSQRARNFNYYSDTSYAQYANSPEIFISVSPNNGYYWSEPIVLNNVDTAQFANLKPMWVYPADKVIYTGMQGTQKRGKLGLMFYDDYTWGSNAVTPPYHPTPDGGRVMFTELHITFPEASTQPPNDPFGIPVTMNTHMTVVAAVSINGIPAEAGDVLAAYVNVDGVPQLRGKANLISGNNIIFCVLEVNTEINGETVYFKIWDASLNYVHLISETLLSDIGAHVGTFPDNLFQLHGITSGQQVLDLQSGWNMTSLSVHPGDPDIDDAFASFLPLLQMIKCPEGVYVPGNPYNSLTQLTAGRGYLIRMSQAHSPIIMGQQISPANPISLSSGWNLAGYTPSLAQPVANAVASLGQNLLQVKGSEGIYIPDNPYNTLSVLSPGRAYWMLLAEAANLVYPNPTRAANPQEIPASKQYSSPVIKPQSEAVLARLGAYASEGDLLAAFVDAELRGLSPIKEVDGHLGSLIQVFTENAGEEIEFKLLKAGSETGLELLPSLSSDPGGSFGDYQSGAYLVLEPKEEVPPIGATRLVNAAPNPFRDGCAIKLDVAKDAVAVRLDIYNLRGQKVACVFEGELRQGIHSLLWDGVDSSGRKLGSGIYFCRLSSHSGTQTLKLMLVK